MIYNLILLGSSLLFGGLILIKILPGRGVGQMEAEKVKHEVRDLPNRENLQLIDVRHPAQFDQFHIYGFTNIPLKNIRKQAKELDGTKKTIVVCQTGAKGNEACKRLKRRGIKNIHNMRGGLSTWDPVKTNQ